MFDTLSDVKEFGESVATALQECKDQAKTDKSMELQILSAVLIGNCLLCGVIENLIRLCDIASGGPNNGSA